MSRFEEAKLAFEESLRKKAKEFQEHYEQQEAKKLANVSIKEEDEDESD